MPKTRRLGALDEGEWFRVGSRPGQTFRTHGFAANGDRWFYGGDKDPKGHQSYGALPASTQVIVVAPTQSGRRAK